MQRERGFTLLEMMIVVVVVGVLAAIAIPAFSSHSIKTTRNAAQQFMLDVATREKQYLLDARAYLEITDGDFTPLGLTIPPEVSDFYTVEVTVPTASTFTITAEAITGKRQQEDGDLTLTHAGAKARTLPDSTVENW